MSQDFTPLPKFSQRKLSNAAWINVTTTRIDADGSISQVSTIVPKANKQ